MRRFLRINLVLISVVMMAYLISGCAVSGPKVSDSLASQMNATKGKITSLRVQFFGARRGNESGKMDTEVAVQLDTEPQKVFGLRLRRGRGEPVREGMLNLLRDAFNHNWTVNLLYWQEPDTENLIIYRVWLTK